MDKPRLFLILQLVYSSYQSDDKGRLLTIMDCLKTIKPDTVKSYNQIDYSKEVANYHAKYIINEYLMFNEKKDSSLNGSSEIYPYFRYRYAILNKVFITAPHQGISIMIISQNCNSTQTERLKVLLQNNFIFCESLNASNFYPIRIFSSFQSLRVKTAILLLPRMFIQVYLEMTAAIHRESFHYITVDYIPDAIRQVQPINPLLKISNFKLVDSPSKFNNGLMNKVNRTECVISKENIYFNDENHVLSCQYQSHRIIRIVTVFYGKLVFRVPNKFPTQNVCEIGLPCKERSKNGRKHWSWLCCAGKYIDKLSAIISHIKHPFIIYIVEDEKYGSFYNGSWNGLVSDLYQDKADIAVAEMTFTKDRYNAIDYIHELGVYYPIAFLLRKQNVEFEILNFSFLPITNGLLLCFVALVFLAVFLMVYIFECIAYQQNYGQKYSFKESWSFVGAILFQRDLGGSVAKTWAGRLLANTYACLMTVMISTYTATLTAENVSYEESPPFDGLRDKIFKDPMKRVGIFDGGITERLADKYNHTCKRVYVENYEDAANYLLQGKLDAIIGTYTDLRRVHTMKNSHCKELIFEVDEIDSEYLSWGCQKNSIICKLFSLSILQLLERRDFESIDMKWISVNSCERKEAKKYPWQYAGGLVICLLVATGICVVILILEKYFASLKWRKRRSHEINNVDLNFVVSEI